MCSPSIIFMSSFSSSSLSKSSFFTSTCPLPSPLLHPSFSLFSCLTLHFCSHSSFLHPRNPSPLLSRSLPSSLLPSISHCTHAVPLQVYICCLTGQIENLSVRNFLPIHSVAGRQTALITNVTNKLWGNVTRSLT